MQRRILLATDLSARCDRAFDRAVSLARAWNARLTVATALEDPPDAAGDDLGPDCCRTEEEVAATESLVRGDLEASGIDGEVVVRRARAGDLIAEVARSDPPDLIVTGIARSTGMVAAILGSTVEAVIATGVAPVLIVKQRVRRPYERVLVGIDFSPDARAALEAAATLLPDAELTVLHAYTDLAVTVSGTRPDDDIDHRHAFDQSAAFVAQVLPGASDVKIVVKPGHAETLLNQYAVDHGIDLVSVGTRGQAHVLDRLFGSTSATLVRSSSCDLLVSPEPAAGG